MSCSRRGRGGHYRRRDWNGSPFRREGATDYPVRVTFRDSGYCISPLPDCLAENPASDRVLSDGKNSSSYTNGEGKNGKVSAVIVNNPDKNLFLDLNGNSTNSGATGRTLQLFYVPATEFSSTYPYAPYGYLNAPMRMVVNKLGTITPGTTTTLPAHFTTDVGMFRFDQMDKMSQYYGSQRVQVTRYDAATWDVSTEFLLDTDGQHSAGDLAVLAPFPSTPLGLYHMPFGATVTCLPVPSPCPP